MESNVYIRDRFMILDFCVFLHDLWELFASQVKTERDTLIYKILTKTDVVRKTLFANRLCMKVHREYERGKEYGIKC